MDARGCPLFGGPAGQIAVMHRILVDEKKWIGESRFLHALSYCMLLPGPEAHQLAIYIGWLMHRWPGAMMAGGLFVLPGIVCIMALSYVYAAFGNVPAVTAFFFGLKAAVLAIVLQGESLLGDELPEHARPTVARAARVSVLWLSLWLGPLIVIAALLGLQDTFAEIGAFFAKMAVVTFGGAYAVLAYMAQQAVETYGWLKPGEMLDGLGMAETTPGPLIMVVQFVGFLAAYRHPGTLPPMLAATLGGLLATWCTFVPFFLWIGLGAPFIERLRDNRPLNGALAGITAAVVGVILNLAIWFALHTIFGEAFRVKGYGFSFEAPVLTSINFWALALSVAAAVAIFRFKTGMIQTLLACSVTGVLLYALGAIR
jgi:chromate transporter